MSLTGKKIKWPVKKNEKLIPVESVVCIIDTPPVIDITAKMGKYSNLMKSSIST